MASGSTNNHQTLAALAESTIIQIHILGQPAPRTRYSSFFVHLLKRPRSFDEHQYVNLDSSMSLHAEKLRGKHVNRAACLDFE